MESVPVVETTVGESNQVGPTSLMGADDNGIFVPERCPSILDNHLGTHRQVW